MFGTVRTKETDIGGADGGFDGETETGEAVGRKEGVSDIGGADGGFDG